ncbi:glycosyltransferase [Blastopirellula marina]|uniref:Glycosyl transferase family 28 C-terminal domain-containing protein n=1 Tax=Blastopirellula marina TaxID=124 RepID=A0A2S8GQF2_9BACT|nr:hypothetical protein [Blastopirellula marina]PQO46659.1 hypothetical protein C5Y93_07440 [Blastopirellula marina]
MTKRICFCWELGGGLGHLGPFQPLARRLVAAGHAVQVIVKDLSRLRPAFRDIPIEAYQAPIKTSPAVPYLQNPPTLGHILLNKGYRDANELASMSQAWRNLFQRLQPDLILCDHAPTALLAARGLSAAKATIGPGFFCPPNENPLPNMSPLRDMPLPQRAADEAALLRTINLALRQNRQPELETVAQLFHDVDRNFFCTFRELDHYPQRQNASYFGAWSAEMPRAELAGWPTGAGQKIFAYLKPMKALDELIRWLYGRKLPTVLVGDRIDFGAYRQWSQGSVRFYERPIQLDGVRRECDVAILNGNHGAACEFLLAGVPTLQIPITFEQGILTQRIVDTGSALFASPENGRQVIGQLSALLESTSAKVAAQQFATKYQDFSQQQGAERLCQQLFHLLGC